MTIQLASTTDSLIPIADITAARARLKDIAVETPFMKNVNLSERYGADIYLKREDMQVVRSFKIRGAYNKIKSLGETATAGIVCASAGNHAQGVALSCARLHIKGKIYMPNPTPMQKVTKVRQFGKEWVEVILTGDSFDDAYAEATADADSSGRPFIHPFDDDMVIAGQGTIAAEMMEQVSDPLDVLLIAVGGGGLISGIGSYYKQLCPHTQIIAVESTGAPALHTSLQQGRVVELPTIDTFADGIAVKQVGLRTFSICQQVVDKSILVPEGQICSAILSLYNDEAIVVEPAGAIAIAALDQLTETVKGKRVGIVVCGGNNDVNRTQEITERALLYEGKKHYFIIRFPQRAGALRDFLNVLGPADDITHFEYTKKTNRVNGPALVGIELGQAADYQALEQRMTAQGIDFQHINNNPMLFEMLV